MNRKHKILAIDDEQINLDIVEEIFEDQGYIIDTALTGEEGLIKAAEFQPDIVLLDIMMPGISGYEVCYRLRSDSRFELTKIIMVTGKAMIEERLRGYARGTDDYISKPFVDEELLAKVKVFLRLVEVERALTALNQSLEHEVQTRSEQLVKAEKMATLGQMASGIVHEIRNPLTSVKGHTDIIIAMVEEKTGLPETFKQGLLDDLAQVRKCTNMMESIVDGLQNFSRDGSGDPFQVKSFDTIIEDAVQLSKNYFGQKNVLLNLLGLPNELEISCKSSQICQVIVNLLNNAVDAASVAPQSWVRLEVVDEGNWVELQVTDSGVPISPDVCEKIMKPFFTTKPVDQGTGLGLTISRGIVTEHQGELFIDETCPNTRFVVRLPKYDLQDDIFQKPPKLKLAP